MFRKVNIGTDYQKLELEILSSNHDLSLPDSFNKYFVSEDYKVLWIFGIPPSIPDQIKKFIKEINKITTSDEIVIFDVSSEAFHIDVFEKYYLNQLNSKCFMLQSGLDHLDNPHIIYHPGFFRWDYKQTDRFEDRKFKYSSLSRLISGRDQRLIFTNELFRIGILDEGLVSCGSGDSDKQLDDFKQRVTTLPDEFAKKLPLLIDGRKVDDTYEYAHQQKCSYHNQEGNPGKDAVINIVLESSINAQKSYIHPSLTYEQGWNRPFYTEKTSKAFNCMQLPLFIAPSGYVKILRDLKFDLFDDIIDHSYDDENSNDARICMVANELKRLIQKDVFKKIAFKYDILEPRLEKNRKNIERLAGILYKRYFNEVENIIKLSFDPLV